MTQDHKIYTADKTLMQKTGTGEVDESVVEKAQTVITENDIDFAPMGKIFLDQLAGVLERARNQQTDLAGLKQEMTEPVMELKANATTFHYPLAGTLADTVLSFLESLTMLDDDAIAIVQAHHKTLNAIIGNEMKGEGGMHGPILIKELQDLCARYYAKHNIAV